MFDYIQTNRLIIRPLRHGDEFALYRYRHLEEVMRYQSWDNYTIEKASTLVSKNLVLPFFEGGDGGNFAVEYQGEMIGDIFVGYVPSNRQHVSIGYTFDPQYQHQGFAREAVQAFIIHLFASLDIVAIDAYVKEGNVPSMRLLLALGFELMDYDEEYEDYGFRLRKP